MNYFHIEGMDLAGKSSATSGFIKSANSGYQTRRNTLQTKSKFHKIVDSLRIGGLLNEEDLGELYFQVLCDDIRNYVTPSQNTIQDSTVILRSIAFYLSINNTDMATKFVNLLEIHPKFTKSVVLTADLDSRLKRLEMRKAINPEEVAADDLMIITDPNRFFLMEKYLIEYSQAYFNAVVVDTSDLDKEEVLDNIKAYFNP
jgi:hypothetical protein